MTCRRTMPWLTRFSLFLAPMAGVTDPVFRSLCKEYGADVLETEFVSADGILQAWERNVRSVRITPEQRPVGVQIFGADPVRMARAAGMIARAVRPDFIDINAGCPVPKVVGKNGGASLMRDLPLLQRIAEAVVSTLGDDCPVTAKIRLGWDAASLCCTEACRRLQDVGVRCVTVHGRTRAQQYGGTADWQLIAECARAVSIPIIGNGDIRTPEDVLRARDEAGVAGAMIGRAAMGAPWLFRRARALLDGLPLPPLPSVAERLQCILRFAGLAVTSAHYGNELCTMRALRARILSLAKGIPGSRALRPRLVRVCSLAELDSLLALLR